jgi:hypothetical protein
LPSRSSFLEVISLDSGCVIDDLLIHHINRREKNAEETRVIRKAKPLRIGVVFDLKMAERIW